MAGSIVQNALSARSAAMQEGDNFRTDRAKIMAGNALKNGDYTAGAGDLYSAGDIAGGQELQKAGQAKADDTASRAGVAAYANQDYAGATKGFAQANDRAGVTAAMSADDAEKKKQLEFTGKVIPVLRNIVDTQGLDHAAAAFDKLAPTFQAMGTDPAHLAQLRTAFVADPKGFLDTVQAATQKQLEAFTLGQGQSRYGPDGKQIASVAPEQKYVPVPEGGKLVPIPNGSTPVAAATPAGGAPAPTGGAPRNQRNNNPGNIEDGQFAKSLPGYKGSDGRFAIFETPQAGQAAQGALLASYGKRGFDTIGKVVGRWAPASDGNDTAAYTKFVSDKLGIAPDEQLDLSNPQVQQGLAAAMAQFEGSGKSASNAATATPAATAAPADPAGTVYGNPKKTARPATAEEKAAYGIAADVPAQMKPDGSIDVISGSGANLKPVPAVIATARIANAKAINQIDAAIAELQRNPNALGLKNYAPNAVVQRADPNGVKTRALIANIGSQIIHDRAGAAVTVSESPRLLPFVPTVTDPAEAAITKLRALKDQYASNNSEIDLAYGPDNGYRPMGGQGGGQPAAQPKPAAKPQPKASTPAPSGRRAPTAAELQAGRSAIQRGADKGAVAKRMADNGINPAGL